MKSFPREKFRDFLSSADNWGPEYFDNSLDEMEKLWNEKEEIPEFVPPDGLLFKFDQEEIISEV